MVASHRHGTFHALRVSAVDRLTDDSLAVTFAVPAELRETYRYLPGQHITARRLVAGEEIRRTYSICTPAIEPAGPRALTVGIRRVEGGEFSTYALKELTVDDTVEVMAPSGRFVLTPRPGHFAAIVGGSGITPVLSIVSTLLAREPRARFCLIRSDRTAASIMFREETADLKDRYPDRFQLVHALSREDQRGGLPSGRLDTSRLSTLLPALLPVDAIDDWFLCGPYGLVSGAERALRDLGVPSPRVHQEIFHPDDTPAPAVVPTSAPTSSTVTATLHGRSGTWQAQDGESVLETVLRNRSDAPYACRGGVCGTCRAKLVHGEVRMDRNFALESEEVDAGYVLSCQSHPMTERVALDYDS